MTYNNENEIVSCLSAVLAEDLECALEVIVVDNGSEDGTLQVVRDRFPGVRIVRSDGNVGFSAANCSGVAASEGEYLIFLNPDTELVPGAVQRMLSEYRTVFRDGMGLLGPQLLNRDGTVQPSCREFPGVLNMFVHAIFLDRLPLVRSCGNYMLYGFDFSRQQHVDWLTGACLLTSRLAYERSGGWDDEFFLFGEDVYLSWCYARIGMQRIYSPEARVFHIEGASTRLYSGRRGRQSAVSEQLLWQKMYGDRKAKRMRRVVLAGLHLRRVLARVTGDLRAGYYDARIHAFQGRD